MTTRTLSRTPLLLGALAAAALVAGPAPALASTATGHTAPPHPPSHTGPRPSRVLAVRPEPLRLRAERADAGYALTLG